MMYNFCAVYLVLFLGRRETIDLVIVNLAAQLFFRGNSIYKK